MIEEKKTLSVSALNKLIQQGLENEFPEIWVEGEISGLAIPSSGHCYFNLKDEDSSIKAVMFRFQATYLKFRLKEGMKVLVRGKITLYKPRGDLQLSVQYMEEQGVGNLFRAFEELKVKLYNEGLFDKDHKLSIPFLPERIGIVTSSTGAALRDFLKVGNDRNSRMEIVVSHSRVQGAGADLELISAIEKLEQVGSVELIVITRGGGSMEDLQVFNSELLARKVYDCKIPVVSAVGHEVDFTILDFVADLRAPTPSAAAEMVIRDSEELENYLEEQRRRMSGVISQKIRTNRMELRNILGGRAFEGLRAKIMEKSQKVDDLDYRGRFALLTKLNACKDDLRSAGQQLSDNEPEKKIVFFKGQFRQIENSLKQISDTMIERARHCLSLKVEALEMISPLAVLGRGYSLCQRENGKIVMTTEDVEVSEPVKISLRKGILKCRVEEKENGKKHR